MLNSLRQPQNAVKYLHNADSEETSLKLIKIIGFWKFSKCL